MQVVTQYVLQCGITNAELPLCRDFSTLTLVCSQDLAPEEENKKGDGQADSGSH